MKKKYRNSGKNIEIVGKKDSGEKYRDSEKNIYNYWKNTDAEKK